MRATFGLGLLAILCGGCLFGGGEEKNGEPNNASSNNSNNSTVANNTTVDMGVPDGTYGPMAGTEVSCAMPRTLWFDPGAAMPIDETSAAALAAPPRDLEIGWTEAGDVGHTTLALATKQAAGIAVVVGTFDMAEEGALVPAIIGSTTIPGNAELREVYVASYWFRRTAADPAARVFTVAVLTSAGVYECGLTLDRDDAASLTCAPSPLNDVLAAADLPRASRVDSAPMLDSNGGAFVYNIVNPKMLALGSGTSGNVEHIFAFRGGDTLRRVSLNGLTETAEPPAVFAERTAFGVESTSFGFPLLLALAGEPLAPVVMEVADAAGDNYRVGDRGEWPLSPRVQADREHFTFVDSYEVTTEFTLTLTARFTQGRLRLGYVGIDPSAEALVFSRPGGFAGTDFLEMPMPGATEVAAFKNLPLEAGATGRSGVVAIHGADADKLAILNWDVGIEAEWVDDALAPGFSGARRLRAPWFLSDRGAIVMLANRNATPVVAVVAVPDLNDLGQTCL